MTEDEKLLIFAERALRGLDDAAVFMGMLGGGPMSEANAAFMLQLGYSVLNDKVIIIPVPYGVEVPVKLAAVADHIVRYNPDDPATLQYTLEKTLTEIGAKLQ